MSKVAKTARAKDRILTLERSFAKLRQLASGYLHLKGDDNVTVDITFTDNPRLQELLDVVDSIPDDRKAIIFHEYTYSGQLITQALKKEKYKSVWLYGGTKDKVGTVKTFQTDPTCRFLVANSRSGGTALDLPMANYCIFFESPVSPTIRQQCERRIARPGQQHHMFFYDIVTRGSMDERVVEFLREGRDLMQALIDGEVDL